MERAGPRPRPTAVLDILHQANQIASGCAPAELVEAMFALILKASGAEAGALLLLEEMPHRLEFKLVKGELLGDKLDGMGIPADKGLPGASLAGKTHLWIPDYSKDARLSRSDPRLRNSLTFPLLLSGQPVGVIQLFNITHTEIELYKLLANRLAASLPPAQAVPSSTNPLTARYEAIVEVIGKISGTLDQAKILEMILHYSRVLLDAESCSIFLVDQEVGDIYLHLSSDIDEKSAQLVRVPYGEGIIGSVVATGKSVMVNDAKSDMRHYPYVDKISGVQTRSILAIPLKTEQILLGSERGTEIQQIIGGVEAINKKSGFFTKEDVQILETFASQAATVFRIAQAYADLNDLFFDVIKAFTAAVDAKDPYTRGHSQRVAEFSVAIARQLQLDPEIIRQVRIGAIMHDLGKIGIPDQILNKAGHLTNEEFGLVKQHPEIGERILRQIKLLREPLKALVEHHERLDGTGYPAGLKGDNISLLGRIVAVADVFDAMTSDRTYRPALPVEDAFHQLVLGLGNNYDPVIVQALTRAYRLGEIKTQKQRIL